RAQRETSSESQPMPEERVHPPQSASPPPPRGYFCANSTSDPTVGFCVRDKAECMRTRDISIAALPDLSKCALVETAWCLSDLCFPSTDACEARRARSTSELTCAESP